jgi:hypothetical protein
MAERRKRLASAPEPAPAISTRRTALSPLAPVRHDLGDYVCGGLVILIISALVLVFLAGAYDIYTSHQQLQLNNQLYNTWLAYCRLPYPLLSPTCALGNATCTLLHILDTWEARTRTGYPPNHLCGEWYRAEWLLPRFNVSEPSNHAAILQCIVHGQPCY